MKAYTSLPAARKSLLIQVSVLFAALLVLFAAGRAVTGFRFSVGAYYVYDGPGDGAEGIHIEWDDEEIPVEEITVRNWQRDTFKDCYLQISLRPEKAGKYVMHVLDSDGVEMFKDTVDVDPLRMAYAPGSGNFTGDKELLAEIFLFYAGLCVIMFVFIRRLKGGLACSYEALLSTGVLIFSLITLVTELPVYIGFLTGAPRYSMWKLFFDLEAGGSRFVIFSFPFLLIFSVLLIISNIELLRHERPRFQNLLGLLLGILLIAGGMIFRIVENRYFQGYSDISYIVEKHFHGSHTIYCSLITAKNVIGVAFAYMECILISSVICGLRAARHKPSPDRDYILILGCGFRKDGTLPPLLRGRVDKAMEFWTRQKKETGKEAVIIPSGGQGPNECMAEAEAMYRYMVGCGFPESLIIREDQSANTYQNMEFSKKIIESREADASKVKTAFATTNYHVFRSGVWAGLAGLNAEGMGSRTKWWFWPNAFIRECVGLLRNRLVPETIFFLILAGVFGFLTYLSLL